MLDFGTKADNSPPPGGQLSAAEFNNLATENENAVSRSGQALSGASTTQLATSLFLHSVKSEAFQDSGLANAYVGTPVSGINGVLLPTTYAEMDGSKISFFASNANSGNSTLNIGQTTGTLLGTKKILNASGGEIASGTITAGMYVTVQYNSALNSGNGAWTLVNFVDAQAIAALAPAVRGTYSKLASSATGTNSNIPITAEFIVVTNASLQSKLLSAVSVTINSAVVGVNGLDTGVLAASTWYCKYIIWNGSTTAGLISLSFTAPTLPVGYTHFARAGSTFTDATVNKYPFSHLQFGNETVYKLAAGSNLVAMRQLAAGVLGNPAVPTWSTVAWANFAPPTASFISVMAQQPVIGGVVTYAASNQLYGTAGTTFQVGSATGTSGASYAAIDLPLESANIYYIGNNAACALYCAGYREQL